jgi:hypothetical protein
MVMEQGTTVGGDPEEVEKGVASLKVGKKARAARAARTFSAASATTHSAGYSKTWLTDPCPAPCIVVNSVQNSIDWYWDGPYLTPGMVETCTARYEWAWQTGWGAPREQLAVQLRLPLVSAELDRQHFLCSLQEWRLLLLHRYARLLRSEPCDRVRRRQTRWAVARDEERGLLGIALGPQSDCPHDELTRGRTWRGRLHS